MIYHTFNHNTNNNFQSAKKGETFSDYRIKKVPNSGRIIVEKTTTSKEINVNNKRIDCQRKATPKCIVKKQ